MGVKHKPGENPSNPVVEMMNKIMIITVALLVATSCSNRSSPSGPILGTVVSADPKAQQVVLDVGKEDGVEKDMSFVIKFARGGDSMPNAKVIRVEKNQCVTTYPGVWMIPVEAGDKAEQAPETEKKETASEKEQSLKTTKTKHVLALTESTRKKATEITIPSIKWDDITVSNALKELEAFSIKNDKDKKGIKILYRSTGTPDPMEEVTCSMANTRVIHVLEYLSVTYNLSVSVSNDIVYITPSTLKTKKLNKEK